MMYFILGIIVGILLSVFAFLAGKKLEVFINSPERYISINKFTPPGKMAEIITKKEPIKDFLEN